MKNCLVDLDEFKMWLDGTLLHFENGKGIVVNELECEAAEEAISRGEEVYLKRGNRLTGTKLVLDKKTNMLSEVEI